MQEQIQAAKKSVEETLKEQDARTRAQELVIGELNKEKLDLGRVISDLHLQIKVLSETLRSRESMIVDMRSKIEPPLEMQNIHLQQRNKFYQQQLRMMKIKYDQMIVEAQQEIREKNIEIEILKEMLKGVQIQLKSKDHEVLRLNKKVLQADG